MKTLRKLVEVLSISQQPKTLLGRWRYVGSQKEDNDIISLKARSKMERHNKITNLRRREYETSIYCN